MDAYDLKIAERDRNIIYLSLRVSTG